MKPKVTESEQARAELISLASKKLGRALKQEEEKEIQRLDSEYLASGYYATLYRGLNAQELLEWFSSAAEVRKQFTEIQHQRDAITKERLEKARVEVVQIATEKLGRDLTRGEEMVIRGFDKSLMVDGDIAGLFRGYSQQELVNTFAEAGAGPGPVILLNSLATGRSSLHTGEQQLIDLVGSPVTEILSGFDFEAALEDFSRWVLNTLRGDLPGRELRALHFALTEVKNGCMIHLSGANLFDPEDADWACTSDWSPDCSFPLFGQESNLWTKLRQAAGEPWVVAQAITIILVRAFFKTHHDEFSRLTGLRRLYIVSGFVDGDLYALRTPLSTRA